VKPVEQWSADEREKRALLEQGIAVALKMRRYGDLIPWRRIAGCLPRGRRHAVGQPVRARQGW
jgi:hypothetical protein